MKELVLDDCFITFEKHDISKLFRNIERISMQNCTFSSSCYEKVKYYSDSDSFVDISNVKIDDYKL